MTWLVPGAFAALALLAGPVIVHLLARRHARRLVFPATHFVRPTQSAAVRLKRPSDIGLLLLRLAIVAAAVLASAQPVVMAPWRLARWSARVSRAVIADASRGLASPGVASRLADQETREVFAARRFDTGHSSTQTNTVSMADAIGRATLWLGGVPPSRREIVIISDFQAGTLDGEDLATIPADVGVRLVRAGIQPETRRATSSAVEGWRDGVWQAATTIDAAGTRVSWTRTGSAGVPAWISVSASAADQDAANRALRAAASLGVPAGDDSHRVVVRFAGANGHSSPGEPVHTSWIEAAASALQHSDLTNGVATLAVSERDGAMIVDVPVAAAAFAAPAIVRAAMLAVRPPTIVDPQIEVATLSDSDLARWRRDTAPVTRSAIPVADDSDARWLWLFALALLGLETRIRRVSRRVQAPGNDREAHADAA
jgi:hypothetical protein